MKDAAGRRRASRRRGIAALALATLLGVGERAAQASELLVGAAASLREPLQAIATDYEAAHAGRRARLAFGASSTLAAQIELGAPIQVFLSADPALIDALAAGGRVAVAERFDFARGRLVVVARAGLERGVASARDLLAPGIQRIALPPAAVPLGRYARAWLDEQGLLAALEPRLVTTEHARATLAAVEQGHADLAIVYATDARVTAGAAVAYEIPAAEQPAIVYTAVRLGGDESDAAARDFLVLLRGPGAARHLQAAGFEVVGTTARGPGASERLP